MPYTLELKAADLYMPEFIAAGRDLWRSGRVTWQGTRRTWSGNDGRPRREAAFALAIYVPERSERRLFLELDLGAALAHLSEPTLGYDSSEKCWINDEYDQVHRDLPQRDGDPLWNRDDFGRDLATALFE